MLKKSYELGNIITKIIIYKITVSFYKPFTNF